jgi:hypothetical protein
MYRFRTLHFVYRLTAVVMALVMAQWPRGGIASCESNAEDEVCAAGCECGNSVAQDWAAPGPIADADAAPGGESEQSPEPERRAPDRDDDCCPDGCKTPCGRVCCGGYCLAAAPTLGTMEIAAEPLVLEPRPFVFLTESDIFHPPRA